VFASEEQAEQARAELEAQGFDYKLHDPQSRNA
jgi:hypothetical protein